MPEASGSCGFVQVAQEGNGAAMPRLSARTQLADWRLPSCQASRLDGKDGAGRVTVELLPCARLNCEMEYVLSRFVASCGGGSKIG